MKRSFAKSCAAVALCLPVAGCGLSQDWLGGIGKKPKSYEIANESVTLTVNKPQVDTQAIAPLIAVAGVGFAIDTIKAEFDKDKDRYTAQYTGTAYSPTFWTVADAKKATLKTEYRTCTLTRTVDGEVACKITLSLENANVSGFQDPEDTSKFISPYLLVKVKEIRFDKAKAKIGWPNDSVKLNLHFVQNAQWLDKDGAIQQKDVATGDWSRTMKLGEVYPPENPPAGYKKPDDVIGVLVAIPSRGLATTKPAVDAGGNPVYVYGRNNKVVTVTKGNKKEPVQDTETTYGTAASLTRLTLQVTETDTSCAKETVERISKAVGDNRDNLTKAIAGTDTGTSTTKKQ